MPTRHQLLAKEQRPPAEAKREHVIKTSPGIGKEKLTGPQKIAKRNHNFIKDFLQVIEKDHDQAEIPLHATVTGWFALSQDLENGDFDENSLANTSRLLSLLSVVSDPSTSRQICGYTPKQIEKFIKTTHLDEPKRTKGYSPFKEKDSDKLTKHTQEQFKKERQIFLASLLPESYFAFGQKFNLQRAIEGKPFRWGAWGSTVSRAIKEGKFEFKPDSPQSIAEFAVKAEQAHVLQILEGKAEEFIPHLEKAPDDLKKAASPDNSSRAILDIFSKKDNFDDWINNKKKPFSYFNRLLLPNSSENPITNQDWIMSATDNHPFFRKKLISHLNLGKDSSSEQIKQKLESNYPNLQTALQQEFLTMITHCSPNMRADIVITAIEQKLSSIETTAPLITLENLNSDSLQDAKPKHAATLLLAGFSKKDLRTKGMSDEAIKKGVKRFILTDENKKIVCDANGKPQPKEIVEDNDFKTEVEKKEETDQYKTQIKLDVEKSLRNDNEEVKKAYFRLAKQRHEKLFRERFKQLTATPQDWDNQKAQENAIIYADNELNRMWDKEHNEPDNTYNSQYGNYNNLLIEAKKLALESQPIKDKIKELSKEKAEKAVDKYKREHMSQSQLAKLNTFNLATLVQQKKITLTNLPSTVKKDVKEIVANNKVDQVKLDQYITTNTNRISGLDLSILLLMIESLSQSLINNLSETEQQNIRKMVT